MKKLLIALFSILMLVGCASKNENTPAYEIDPVATDNAPWEAGDVTMQTSITLGDNVAREVNRVFLGVTTKGYYVVQEFYNNSDIQATSPFVLRDQADVKIVAFPSQLSIEGDFVQWYIDGQKYAELSFKNGVEEGALRVWYPDGQLHIENYFSHGAPVGLWRVYDENGETTLQRDFGAP